MKKPPIPSVAQAKLIARIWSDCNSIIKVMTRGRDGGESYVDPTVLACIRRGWFASNGSLEFQENGCGYIQHELTAHGFLALERFLSDMRINLRDVA